MSPLPQEPAPTSPGASLLELRGAVFGQGHQPLTGPIDLVLHPGEKLLLQGPSGTGKTSLLRGLLGFLPLLDGHYSVHGAPAEPAAIWQLRRTTAYVTQELLVGHGSVRAWLQEHLFSTDSTLHQTDLSSFHLSPHILGKGLEDLSRGERQRLVLLAALRRQPSLFLLDEVTSALNRELRHAVAHRFSQSPAAVLAVSHDADWLSLPAFRAHSLPPAVSSTPSAP